MLEGVILFNFWPSDFIGKVVLLMLIAASFYIWGVIFKKIASFLHLSRNTEEFKKYVYQMPKLKKLIVQDSCLHFQIYDGLFQIYNSPHLEENAKSLTQALITHTSLEFEIEYEKSLNMLSIIGSISPFVGLFGTVFGIMHSLQSIAHSNSTSITIVAPGISEALFATAVGLCVAIPAAIATHLSYAKIEEMQKDASVFAMYLVKRLENNNE